jgi:hypothetical protein
MFVYILDDDGNTQQVDDLHKWAEWYCRQDQSTLTVDLTPVSGRHCVMIVETKFVGRTEAAENPPLVWLSQVKDTDEKWRAATRKDAVSNHKRMVKMLEKRFGK